MDTTKTKTQVSKSTAELFESHVKIQRRSIPEALKEAVELLDENNVLFDLETPLRYFQIEIPYDVWGKMQSIKRERKLLSSYAWNTAMVLFVKKYE